MKKNLLNLCGLFAMVILMSSSVHAQIISTIVGTGTASSTGDGGLATAANTYENYGLDVDVNGNIYFTEYSTHRVRKIDGVTGIISTIAGLGVAGSSGDGGLATAAGLDDPLDVAVDGNGNIYIGTYNGRIRRIDGTTGIITTVAGTGVRGYSGDGGLATSAQIDRCYGIETDAANNVYFTQYDQDRVRKLTVSTGIISTAIGTGAASSTGDGGLATSATIDGPLGIGIDQSNNIYLSEWSGYRIRKVNATTGIINTIAGTGVNSSTGDGGLATAATIRNIWDVSINGNGDVFIAGQNTDKIRKVDGTTGNISTVIGTGIPGFSGDGGLANAAQIDDPRGIIFDQFNNLFICDRGNRRIRRVDYCPTVTLSAPADLCINDGIQSGLGGGTPTGGVYSGPGVTDDGNGTSYSFNPNTAGTGVHTITYTHNNGAGCIAGADDSLSVNAVDTSVVYTSPTITSNATGATYQWIDCASGDSIAGETNQAFTAITGGSYAVIVGANGCVETSACVTVTIAGIDGLSATQNVVIAPNPTNGIFTIDLSKTNSKATILVYDALGKVVFNKEVEASKTEVDLTENNKGLYFVKIQTESSSEVKRIILQ